MTKYKELAQLNRSAYIWRIYLSIHFGHIVRCFSIFKELCLLTALLMGVIFTQTDKSNTKLPMCIFVQHINEKMCFCLKPVTTRI